MSILIRRLADRIRRYLASPIQGYLRDTPPSQTQRANLRSC